MRRLIATAIALLVHPLTAAPLADYRVETLAAVASGWALAQLPDGAWLVTQKPGELRRFADGRLGAPIVGVPAVVDRGQGGLADVILDPGFARNRTIYLSYAEAGPGGSGEAVARAVLDGGRLSGVKVIWRQSPKVDGNGHFSGRMAFGPDGKLYIGSGERQKFTPAQDRAMNLGKIVRIGADGSIPADNPFAAANGTRPDIWSLGHRNVLGVVCAPDGRLFDVEMGPKGGDEVNIVRKGANYGWPVVSWGDHYDGRDIPNHDTRPDFAPPAVYWNPVISPSSMVWWTGGAFPAWRGQLVIGGLSSQSIVRVAVDGAKAREVDRIDVGARVREVAQGTDGALYILTDGTDGKLMRLTPKR